MDRRLFLKRFSLLGAVTLFAPEMARRAMALLNPTKGMLGIWDGVIVGTHEGKLTTDLIAKAVKKAETITPRIKPIKIDGKSYYVWFTENRWQNRLA